jgi:subtilisin family serine protease
MMATGLPSDPEMKRQWGLNNVGQAGGVSGADIHALDAWNLQTNAANVVVGVIDTGIDYTHPDLAQNIWTNPGEIPGNHIDDDSNGFVDDVHGWDFTNDSNNPSDENNHGTHVAGVIGARGNNGAGITGVAWEVSLMPVKFLDANGIGLTSDAVDAVNYATLNGANVTCASWAGYGFSSALHDAFGAAATAGVIAIASAGNEAVNSDTVPSYPAGFDLANIVSVGASDGADQLAGFSNYGATSVDFVAPGVGIYSTIADGNYGTFSGTSTAAPLAAGAVALLKASEPTLTTGEITARLLSTAHSVPELHGKTVSGGRLDVGALLSAAPTRIPVIAGPFKRNGIVGVPFTHTIHAVHDPTIFGAAPLPAGLSINTTTGEISGIPQVEGVVYVTLTASNSAGSDSAALELDISGSGAPEILSATSAAAILGTTFSYQILASNSPTSYDATGLPVGLSVDTTTGLVSGTPTVGGSFRIIISATNNAGTGDAELRLTVNYPAPVITSDLSATAIVGRPFYYAVAATNNPDTFGASGLPEGLHISQQVGIISGVPRAVGTYPIGLSASNASGTGTAILVLNVVDPNPQTRVFSFSPASAVAGQNLVLTGQGFTQTSNVYFSDWRDQLHDAAFTVVSDTELRVTVPYFRASWFRDYASRITVISSSGATVTLPGDIRVVNSGESILAQGGGSGYLIRNGGAVSGGGAGGLLMYLEQGAAADSGGGSGHTFYVEDGAFAKLSSSGGNIIFLERGGVVVSGSGGSDPNVQAMDVIEVPALNPSVLGALPRILPIPKIVSGSLATATLGQLFSYTIALDSQPSLGSVTFDATGLPAGISVDGATGLISGTPTQSGTFSVTLSATNSYGTDTLLLTLSVNSTTSPVITNAHPVEGHSGQAFSFGIQATNSPTSYDATRLPAGLSIDAASGVISGVPAASGIFRANITATNANGTGNATLLVLIDRVQPQITGFSQATAARGQTIRIQGQGFTDATTLLFSDMFAGFVPANFTVLSDTLVEVVIPDVKSDWTKDFNSILVLATPAGATATVPANYHEVNTTIAPSAVDFYLVRSGGALSGGGSGSVTGYLESGGLATTGGGGGHTYFAEAGAAVNLNGGGGHRLIHAAGAIVTGSPQFLLEVESLKPSFPPALLRVPPIPKITSLLLASGTVGHLFSYQITAESSVAPATSFSATGLPAGLAIDSATGHISGTPQVEGTFSVTLGAANQYGTGTAQLTLAIDDPMIPIIATSGQYSLDLGYSFSLQIVASYNPTSYAATGLPAGLTINGLTGLISGTPSGSGVFTVAVTATNSNGSGNAAISFLVGVRPTLITSLPAKASVGSTLDIQGQGFTDTSAVYFSDFRDDLVAAPTFTVASDSLLRVTVPSITTSSFNNNTSRILIVTPAGATVSIPTNYVNVTSTISPSSISFYLVQNGGSLAGGGSGGVKAYLRTGAAASTGGGGGHTYFAEDGATVDLGSGGGGHRVIYTPGANVIGTPFTAIAVASLRPSIVSLVRILPVPGITSSRTATASLALPFIYTTTATNSPTSFGATGLPPGLSINTSNGIISGTPVGNDTVYEVTLTATNSSGAGSASLLLTVRDDYKQWKIASFAPLFGGVDNPLAQDMADADGDGLHNLMEFATGGDPLKADSQTRPLAPVSGVAGHQFRYRRLRGNGTGATTDGYTLGTITYTVYLSTDLVNWNTGSAYMNQVGTPVDNGDGTETVTIQATGSALNHFAKLNVTRAQL